MLNSFAEGLRLFSPLIAAIVAWAVCAALLRSGLARALLDQPNARSLHQHATPRIGGIGLMAGAFAGWLAVPGAPWQSWWLLWPLSLLIAVSLLDDRRGMPVALRLSVQAAAAVIFLLGFSAAHPFGPTALPFVLLLVLFFFAIVWMINLYNFMDGADGLAGGMALMGFSAYGFAALMAGHTDFSFLNFALAAASGGFLTLNFAPAKIFLGDAGSVPLGFLAAALGLLGWQMQCWPLWFAPLVFSLFIVDSSYTLVRRALRGAKVWQAHREHCYQRCVQMGCSHRTLARGAYALMLLSGLSALLLRSEPWPLGALLLWALGYALLIGMVEFFWQRKKLAG